MPVYLEVPSYRELLDQVDEVKSKLLKAKQVLHEIHGLRAEENHEMHIIQEGIKQINERLDMLDEELYHG